MVRCLLMMILLTVCICDVNTIFIGDWRYVIIIGIHLYSIIIVTSGCVINLSSRLFSSILSSFYPGLPIVASGASGLTIVNGSVVGAALFIMLYQHTTCVIQYVTPINTHVYCLFCICIASACLLLTTLPFVNVRADIFYCVSVFALFEQMHMIYCASLGICISYTNHALNYC